MHITIGQVVLGIYALLLAGGGIMGFVKAGSRPSLTAGLISAVLAVVALVTLAANPELGRTLGMLLALVMTVVFGYRYALKPKFMPSGLLAILSLVVLIVMFLVSTTPA